VVPTAAAILLAAQLFCQAKMAVHAGAADCRNVMSPSVGLILGYIENKPIGENLDKVLKSEQIAEYEMISHTTSF
jgi:hypothetical protein